MDDAAFMKHPECHRMPTVDAMKTSSCTRELITHRDLRHVLYDRNPVRVVHVGETRSENVTDGLAEKECEKAAQRSKISNSKETVTMPTSEGKPLQLSYAIASFPDEVQLCVSGIPGAGYGVCAKQHIPVGTWIGPYEGKRVPPENLTSDMNTSYMWEIFEDGKLVYFLDGSDASTSSWMRFIRCARYKREQNLFAFQHAGSIYYRAFREISQGSELLVWYDSNYQQHVGIPVGNWEQNALQCFPGRRLTVRQPNMVRISRDNRSELQDTSSETMRSSFSGSTEGKRRNGTLCGLIHQVSCDRVHGQDLGIMTSRVQRHSRRSRIQVGDDSSQINRETGLLVSSTNSNTRPDPVPLDSRSPRNLFDEVIQKNNGGELFKCGQCKQTFSQRSLLHNHLCPHLPSKPYRCGHCPESFAQPKELRTHAVLHISEKPFKCGYCLRSFAGATTLDNHVRTHTGEKPFLCEKCGKTFPQASQLSRHQRICQEH